MWSSRSKSGKGLAWIWLNRLYPDVRLVENQRGFRSEINKLERFYEQCFLSIVVDGAGGSILFTPARASLDVVFTDEPPPPPKSLQGGCQGQAAHRDFHGFDSIIRRTGRPCSSRSVLDCASPRPFARFSGAFRKGQRFIHSPKKEFFALKIRRILPIA